MNIITNHKRRSRMIEVDRHLSNPVVAEISSDIVELCLKEEVLHADGLLKMSLDEQNSLKELLRDFRSASSADFELGATICKKFSNGEDAIGAMAIMLYREAQRRAVKQ